MSKVLVLGGTRFFGKALVNNLLMDNNDVTIATRGITKDDYGNKVNRIILDREDRNSIENALKDKDFDAIYDNICYSPNSAKKLLEVIKGKTKKYIVISSAAIYDFSKDVKEEDYDFSKNTVQYGERNDFSYSEGKRQVESYIFKENSFEIIAVRFPVVLGEDDYTKRLYFYVDKILNGKPMRIDNMNGKLSFINSKEAGKFLKWLKNINFTGPINACSEGYITIKEIIEYIEEKSNVKALIKEDGEVSPYNEIPELTLNTDIAKNFGYEFQPLKGYIFKLLDGYIEEIKNQ